MNINIDKLYKIKGESYIRRLVDEQLELLQECDLTHAEIGDYLLCVDKNQPSPLTTIGKKYKILSYRNRKIGIKNDAGRNKYIDDDNPLKLYKLIKSNGQ